MVPLPSGFFGAGAFVGPVVRMASVVSNAAISCDRSQPPKEVVVWFLL
jgi:hypothetical protein